MLESFDWRINEYILLYPPYCKNYTTATWDTSCTNLVRHEILHALEAAVHVSQLPQDVQGEGDGGQRGQGAVERRQSSPRAPEASAQQGGGGVMAAENRLAGAEVRDECVQGVDTENNNPIIYENPPIFLPFIAIHSKGMPWLFSEFLKQNVIDVYIFSNN